MNTKKTECEACRKLGHDRDDCPVLKAGKEALKKKAISKRCAKDMRFHLEGLQRAAKEMLIEKYGKETFERMLKEHKQLIDGILRNRGDISSILDISPERAEQFLEALKKAGGHHMNPQQSSGETITEYWERRRREEQERNSGLN